MTEYNSSVFMFDEQQQLIRIVTREHLTQLLQEKEITPDKSELLADTLKVASVYDQEIASAAYMAVKESDDSFSMYANITNEDPHNRNEFTGINFALKELEGYVVKDIRPTNRGVSYVATQILAATDGEWRLGYVKPNLPAVTDTFYYLSVKDCLKQLQSHGCEILFKCKIEGTRITDKWIEIYDKIGEASNERFVYGASALSIVKEEDRSQIFTSLIGRGKGEEVGDGYGRRIEFTDVVWKKSAGKPIDKPAGQNWIELPEMTEKYGIPLKNGKMRKREGVMIFDDIEDKEQLLLNTYNALVEISRPLVQFKTNIFGGDDIGNTIQLHRYDRGYHYRARIFKVSIDRLTGRVSADVGDNLAKKSSIKTSSDIKLDLERLDEEKATFYTSEEIAKWQSDIIRGGKGGSFVMLNQQDLGKGEDRTPFCTVWMNGKSLETSDHFLVANSEGIGFIDGDFNLDNFHTAWTIDGVFNAKFIQTGILAGPNFFLNLDTGVAEFAKGKIKGPGLDINMTTGDVQMSRGSITGPGLDINMTTGDVRMSKGKIQSADGKSYLDLNAGNFKLDNGTITGTDIRGSKVTAWDQFGTLELDKGKLTFRRIGGSTFGSYGPYWTTAEPNGTAIRCSGANPFSVLVCNDENEASWKWGTVGFSVGGSVQKPTVGVMNLNTIGSKNAIHVTRDGVRATPAYEMAETYLGDMGRGQTNENGEVWVPIETIFSDTVNTDIPYEVFLQPYDNANFWIADFRSDQFLVESDKPKMRFAWEIKAKRRGYEKDRLVKQEYNNARIEEYFSGMPIKMEG
ncbi:phage tail spike protein [Enterococcus hirae]|nr:phage tail spike protein [Enterococcus hirae]